MADNYAGYDQPTTVDKALRTRDAGTVGGQVVEDQYVVDSDRAALVAAIQAIDDNLATEVTVGRRFGVQTTRAQRISASGNNTVITPAAGLKVRLHWVALSAPETNSEVLAVAKFGSTEIYRWNLCPSGAFSHWQAIDGAIDQPFVINLSGAQPIDVNYTWQEI